ncbi:MAG: LLM class flavin-dependent oxidoreductase [Chloroflexi bacterium]|nr:LLM class flavin-dependent oxidoreductase [Chloroflexota bacterium]
MKKGTGIIGIAAEGKTPTEALAQIRRAEELGVPAAWMTSGGQYGESMTVLTVAAAQTGRILLGTAIAPIWLRHPVLLAQQVQVAANLAPNRFRLGVGPAHKQGMVDNWGVDFREPLGHLREYIEVLKPLLQQGKVDHNGPHYTAHATLPSPTGVPVMASALRTRSFELCGEVADGAITWVCPFDYVRKTALPALQASAKRAGRATPPLIVHTPVCVSTDAAAVREGVRKRLGYFPTTRFYEQMFEQAGFPNSSRTGWTDELIDAVSIYGDETQVIDKLQEVFAWGASEVIASVITVGPDRQASADRTMRALAAASAG